MVERIKKIIEKEDSNPSLFADRIGISRGTMNHILNGRNNPSLDVVTKILEGLSHINTEWLMFGNGPMYKGDKVIIQPTLPLFDEIPVKPHNYPEKIEYRKEIELKTPEKPINNPEIEENILPKNTSRTIDKTIDKIIIYYSDNTFENFIRENR
ncbi:MAG: helix-turn-helix domain-containing protein [Dysgonamonadaceae bacterium]|jgi:transcriptional regulator with XRE-family HTH domain|nr:helix-turn-helix domain-containing protein [Dysgonamonadaceae bacterium]